MGITHSMLWMYKRVLWQLSFKQVLTRVSLQFFAWLTIIIAVRSLTIRPPLLVGSRLSISIVVSALLATLLNLVLEPVAFHIERYWIWLAPGNIAYYGVPLMNFVAWFVASLVLL